MATRPMVKAAEREGDAGATTALAGQAHIARDMTSPAQLSAALVNRATITRQWQVFLARYPVVLLPVCAELAIHG